MLIPASIDFSEPPDPDWLDAESVLALAEPAAAEIATELLGPPNAKLSRRSRFLSWGRHGSLRLNISGDRAGQWQDFETGTGGNLISLIRRELGLSYPDAIAWLAGRVGGVGLSDAQSTARIEERRRRAALAEIREREREAAAIEAARRLWAEAVPPTDTLVQRYLENRECWTDILADGSAIRFHPECPFRIDDALTSFAPTMLTAMVDPATGDVMGIHRTHLSKDGKKGPLGKRMLGLKKGCVALLKPWASGATVAFAEGIENALSALSVDDFGGIVSAFDAGNLATLPALPAIGKGVIFADKDAPGMRAAEAAAGIYAAAGVPAWIASPREHADLNDLTKAKPARTAIRAGFNISTFQVVGSH